MRPYRRDEHVKRIEHAWYWTDEKKVQACARCPWQKRGDIRYRRGADSEWVSMSKRPACER